MIRPRSILVLTLGGLVIIGLGLYFALLRPPLLDEDARFMGSSREAIEGAVPGLAGWLRWVFAVVGGFMAASGLLTVYVANTALRARSAGGRWVIAISGLVSIGWMAVVNVMIGSDFEWPLVTIAMLWPFAFVLYSLEGRGEPRPGDAGD